MDTGWGVGTDGTVIDISLSELPPESSSIRRTSWYSAPKLLQCLTFN